MVFREFSSFEEMQTFMRAAEAQANTRVTDAQREVEWGNYYYRFEQGLHIFSYCPTLEELERTDRDHGGEDEEIQYMLHSISDAHRRGYRYGRHYSTEVPDGEWGSAHLSVIGRKIAPAEFEQARAQGWAHPPA